MDVLICGTLTDTETAGRILDRFEFRGQTHLDGPHRVDGDYPTLVPGGTCAGPFPDRVDRYLKTGAVSVVSCCS